MSAPVPVPDPVPDVERPHYIPDEVWLGVQIGEWPLQAFTNTKHAAHWASENDHRRVWKVSIPKDVTVYKGEVVPRTHVLCEVDR